MTNAAMEEEKVEMIKNLDKVPLYMLSDAE